MRCSGRSSRGAAPDPGVTWATAAGSGSIWAPARSRFAPSAVGGVARELPPELAENAEAVIGELERGRVLALVPLVREHPERDAGALADRLGAAGFEAAVSAPAGTRRSCARRLREAMLLAELSCAPEAALAGQEETYRLLIGVLLRDPEELELLRSRARSRRCSATTPSTTPICWRRWGRSRPPRIDHRDTAEAMGLHRHTVGYRLSRVHEVSGLSAVRVRRPRAPQPRVEGRADPGGPGTTMKPG